MTGIDIDVHLGTTEAVWRSWSTLPARPRASWPRHGRVVVVVPHPDDDVLALGATLRHLHRRLGRITFIALTDGEASHPGSTAITPDQLRLRRPVEATAARARLGLHRFPVHRLGLPDGAVSLHLDRVASAVSTWAGHGDLVLAPWAHDGHPDHDAAGAGAAIGAAEIGARLVTYPVWMWNWARPGDPRVPWDRARLTPVTTRAAKAKAAAVAAHATQVQPVGAAPEDGPVLPAAVLDHFARPFEVVFW